LSVIGLKLLALTIIPVIHNGTVIHQRLCRLVAPLGHSAMSAFIGGKADIGNL
jgi:hypothetical protein